MNSYTGQINSMFATVIPFILYVSLSVIKSEEKMTETIIYSLHVTPWISVSFSIKRKVKFMWIKIQ